MLYTKSPYLVFWSVCTNHTSSSAILIRIVLPISWNTVQTVMRRLPVESS